MSANDLVVLDALLAQRKSIVGDGLSNADFFEIIAAEQILREFDLSYDEILSGICDGGDDAGFDSVYILLNKELMQDAEIDIDSYKSTPELHLVGIQSKSGTSFKESPAEQMATCLSGVLALDRDLAEFRGIYNDKLLEQFGIFRQIYLALASKFPKLKFSIRYVTRGDTGNINKRLNALAERIKTTVRDRFSVATAAMEFIGASELLALSRERGQESFSLRSRETPMTTDQNVYVCLVNLVDYAKFVTSPDGSLNRRIFESNVRDYQGRNKVNRQIAATLESPASEDFWWLNNGVTVLASKASSASKTVTIENPEIVNGLQTSNEIYSYFSSKPGIEDSRNILVRIIVPDSEETRDAIIKATNSQTAIPQSSLRATDKVHRDIEEYFKPNGLYYDRRKNFYKNLGKPMGKIISLQFLGQALMTVLLQRPDTARARPSTLLNNDDEYTRLFSDKNPMQLYFVAAQLMRIVDDRLKASDTVTTAMRNNIKYYVLLLVCRKLTGMLQPNAAQLSAIDLSTCTESMIDKAIQVVSAQFGSLGATDRVAKGPDLLAKLNEG